MKKADFIREFKALLPDSISDTSIDINDPETTTLLFIGETIVKMGDEYQDYFDSVDSGMIDDQLIQEIAEKYNIEW
jgi:hypothetical protein